jgi:hypothetical protein
MVCIRGANVVKYLGIAGFLKKKCIDQKISFIRKMHR